MLNALTNVRFWGKADIDQPLLARDAALKRWSEAIEQWKEQNADK